MNLFIFFVYYSLSFSPDHAITFDIIAPYHPIPLFEQFLFFLTEVTPFSAKEYLREVLLNYSAIEDADFLYNLADSYISPNYRQLMSSQIENGYFLPRGEMFRKIAMDLDNKSDLIINDDHNKITFSNSERINKDIPFTSDIKFGSSNIYVYANLHNKTIASEILSMITAKRSFILRPFSKSGTIYSKLGGFGIELQANQNSQKHEITTISDDYIKYKTVTDETIGKIEGIPPSYVNPILYQRLGPKLANYLRKNNDSLPEILRDITSNYPLFLPLILSSYETRDDQISYQKVSHLMDNQPFSMSFLNGRHIQLNNVDLFNLFDIIHQENNMNSILERKYRIDRRTIKEITEIPLQSTDNLFIDYRSEYIIYINDLESDPQYENWTNDINEIYNITSKFPQIKKNLLNLVLYANPTTNEGATSLFEIVAMMQKKYPIRFGFMPLFNLENKFERKVAYAFSYLASKSNILAIQYLINVYEKIGIDHQINKLNQIKENVFMEEFDEMSKSINSEFFWNNLFSLFDSESIETRRLIESHRYLKKHGINKQTVLINGRFIQAPNFSPSILNIEFQASYLILQSLFTQHNIRSLEEFDVIDFLKQKLPTIETLDQRIYFTLPKGIDIFSKKLAIQVEFNDFLPKINWNYINGEEEDASSFVWLFYPEKTNLTVFNQFMKSGNLSESTMFAFNPPIPECVYQINKEIVTLIFNGRVYENANINDYDFLINLDIWSHNFVSKPLSNFIRDLKFRRKEIAIYLSCVYNDWMMNGVSRGSINQDVWTINSSLVYKPERKSDSFGLNWELVVDPFSSEFQKIAPIIDYFDKKMIVNFRFVLVPPRDITKTDNLRVLESFFRMSIGEQKTCVFTLLNKTTSYSVVRHLPRSWLVENLRASFDLSDIQVDRLKPGIHSALFALSSLVVEGRCFTELGDVAENVELSVYEKGRRSLEDTTTVMKTNGYWQLKVNGPGQFSIEIDGKKANSMFQKVSHNFLFASFSSASFHRIELVYQAKRIDENQEPKRNDECLNVFSVCDGFKSEEKVTKMIISVAMNMKSPEKIKFWFLRAYLSPQFKATLQKLAFKYSIKFCLTDYKWPNWLKLQKNRSDKLLAYKVLFLDMLFRSEKGRVLYMDPNSFVKEGTDLFNLFNSYSFFEKDHYSAPTLAFPSFSNTRSESEPLRFWKSGYWFSLLQGKEFINTDLFLLDLRRFKESGSAELLRYIYQITSSDPTSLSTLDQYLINFIQVQMPMKILPSNYYGCDLWNDDKSMENIKIVNLCDYPYTHLLEIKRSNKYKNLWINLQKEIKEVKSRNNEFMMLFFKNYKKYIE